MSTLKLKGSTSGYVELTAPATAGDNTITLPTTAGTVAVKDASNNTEVGTGVTIGSPSSNVFTVSTNGSERVRVNSSGNVGIGTDIPADKLHVQNGAIVKDQGADQNSANPGIQLKHAGTIYGSWRHDGRLEVGGQDGNAKVRLDVEGIKFNGDTATANALDDYEEGTFTPVLSDASSAGNTTTGGTVYGYYLKVGKWVTCTIGGYSFSTSGMTAGNTFYVQGLPFQCQATGPVVRHVGAVTAERCNGSTNSMTFQVVENQVYGLFVQNGETGASARTVIVSDFSTGNSYFRTTIAYSTV